jgi:hypothetical protein
MSLSVHFSRRRMARISKTIEKERSVREKYIAKLNDYLV